MRGRRRCEADRVERGERRCTPSRYGLVDIVQLLLACEGVRASLDMDSLSALSVASLKGHGAIVRVLVAHSAAGRVRELTGASLGSLPVDLLDEPAQSPGDAAEHAVWERDADAALRATWTVPTFLVPQRAYLPPHRPPQVSFVNGRF